MNPLVRWQSGHGYKGNTYFTRAILKYGWDNFSHEILYDNLTEEEAKKEEIRLIAKYKSNQREFGFNISSGGESKAGTKISEWQKKRIREANKGKIVSEETRRKLSETSKRTWSNPDFAQHMAEINTGEKNPQYGIKRSREEKIIRGAKIVVQFSIDGDILNEYISIHEANEKTGVRRDGISKCCRGVFRQAGGYIWRYKKDVPEG